MTQPNAILFYLVSAFVLASGVAVVGSRNLFHSGIALISCFLGVAGVYVLLSAPFIGAMEVLIYAGAIAVVLLFAFMLTHDLMHPKVERFQNEAGLIASVVVGVGLSVTAAVSPWHTPGQVSAQPSDVSQLATAYMTTNFVAFQLAALLLLVSLIGAIVIARKEEGPNT